jgi:hypothetical protein
MADQQTSDRGTGRELRGALIMVAAFAVIAVVFAVGALVYSLGGGDDDDGVLRAVIVDQLDLTFPNQEFRNQTTETLEAAGYVVDYVPGEDVTVDYYRELPTHDYDLVLLRSHVARLEDATGERPALAEIFTAEPYTTTDHVWEREQGYIGSVAYFGDEEGGEAYFGIGPAFVLERMNGSFNGSTIVMMGCSGLFSEAMAEAFIRKGADSFVSWDDLVSAQHTDAATSLLVERMVVDELSVADATKATMAELGPDPYYESTLLSYPSQD